MIHIQFLQLNEVIEFHRELVVRYGGLLGIRDLGLLESAVLQPQISFDGKYLYSTVHEMAAVYMVHVIKNHAFIDGNKRTGVMCAIIFLEINGFEFKKPSQKSNKDILYELAIKIAAEKMAIKKVTIFLRKYFVAI